MKIEFEDKSLIEIKKIDNKYSILIQAKDGNNPKIKISNCVEITKEQLQYLLKDLD